MLIYNFQKEFLGIDEKDLKTLGFNTLSELRAEITDFADLFVKRPGYVHNFKHVHWIDFVSYGDIPEESKVLISVNSKTFKATLSVSSLFLTDNPDLPAYIIHLNNLSSDLFDRELPKAAPQEPEVSTPEVVAVADDDHEETFDTDELSLDMFEEESNTLMSPTPEPVLDVFEEESNTLMSPTPEPVLDVFEEESNTLMSPTPEPVLDVFEEESNTLMPPTPEPADELVALDVEADKQPVWQIAEKELEEEWDNGYRYDPGIASKELGLPLSLIEEFIQDFIVQAKEFKSDIDKSIAEGNVENVKILAHKLRGVAANLRIEDAHEILSVVSATEDISVIEDNFDIFYKIIAKLVGKEEIFSLDFRDDEDIVMK